MFSNKNNIIFFLILIFFEFTTSSWFWFIIQIIYLQLRLFVRFCHFPVVINVQMCLLLVELLKILSSIMVWRKLQVIPKNYYIYLNWQFNVFFFFFWWCEIINACFFRIEATNTVTINEKGYRSMATNFL